MSESDMTNPPILSVVIPTRDRPDDLARVLQALETQDYPRDRFEVIVCDDGSIADIGAVVRHFANRLVAIRYVRQEPRGPAAARNLGIRNARAQIVAMTDSDTRPDRGWLSAIARAFASHPEAAGVEGRSRQTIPENSILSGKARGISRAAFI